MTFTDSPAASARPDKTRSQRRWKLAMQSARQQALAEKGVRVTLAVRTGQQKKHWVAEATERRLDRYFGFEDAVKAGRQKPWVTPDGPVNPVYPDWAEKHYHGD
ncbi:hypothetical protein [Pantoea piersonii]|jgi:hypothetical protein|uniref:hypothetical protein n=1 Tax=Pantoea piersonii TaxID=2364647 RepID=UPI0011C3FEDC|nr:hypothetical protein [Pantoea piersonii]MBZ6387491.1 hypothetical protein [Pantoea piersonii]MBZ6400759.1 hypothetical protein [Pantoea piersonii]MBZ6408915.1 hypothetical protein [Pantoea piersonii]MBZ6427098.1 hypothetical protein [Pantoea piersonii]NYB04347.1 hypothetical protein [Pantoea piersonii]